MAVDFSSTIKQTDPHRTEMIERICSQRTYYEAVEYPEKKDLQYFTGFYGWTSDF